MGLLLLLLVLYWDLQYGWRSLNVLGPFYEKKGDHLEIFSNFKEKNRFFACHDIFLPLNKDMWYEDKKKRWIPW